MSSAESTPLDAPQPAHELDAFTPVISCDIRLGELVCDIEVDAEFFAAQVANRVGTPTGETQTIHFSADSIVTGDPQNPGLGIGHYDPTTRTTTTNVGTVRYIADYFQDLDNTTDEEADRCGSEYATKNAVHETTHALDHIVLGDARLEEIITYLEPLVPPPRKITRGLRSRNPHKAEIARVQRRIQLLEHALALPHDHYRGAPAEVRANAAANAAVRTADTYPVRLRFKR